MDLEAARDFVRANSHATLATLRRDGGPQLSLVDVAVDDAGCFVVSSRETAVKVRNLRRTPRAWLLVMTERFYGGWVQVEGRAEIVSLPEAMEPLVDYYRRLSGEHPDWADYRAAMERDRRVLIRVTADRVGPTVSG